MHSATQDNVTKRPLRAWIISGNIKLQIILAVSAAIAVFTRVLPLEMQKRIVNEAINLRKTQLLITYCAIYLAAFVTAAGLKYLINALQTLIGQRTVAKMRRDLYDHLLRLPMNFFRKSQPGTVVSAFTTELATTGDFVGMAVSVPFVNVLTLLAFAGYLVWLNAFLAAVSMSIYPLILLVVPRLQKRVNVYNKKRIDAGRKVSGKVAESVSGIHEIKAHGAYSIEHRKFGSLVDRLHKIRTVWRLYRYAVKSANNLFTNLSRFLIFALGGYLAIQGRLELGALVAFLSAQEKLYDPWKELITFYQAYQTATVTYARTMQYFDVSPEVRKWALEHGPGGLQGHIEVKDISFVTEDDTRLLNNVSFSLEAGQHLALVGFSGSGKSTLAHCLIQLLSHSQGQILIDETDVSSLSIQDIIHNVGFVSQTPFIFEGTIEENLLYAYLADLESTRIRDWTESESQDSTADGQSQQSDLPVGEDPLPDLNRRIEVLQQTGIFVDVLGFGLNAQLPPGEHDELVAEILRVRRNFKNNFADDLQDYVEFYQPDRYLRHSSIAENLLFGTPRGKSFSDENLVHNEFFQNFLRSAELIDPLLKLGARLVEETSANFGHLVSAAVFEQLSPLAGSDLAAFEQIDRRLKKKGLQKLGEKDRKSLLRLALNFTPAKHKLLGLPAGLRTGIVEARKRFRDRISADAPDAVSFYRESQYIHPQSILTNIFFGKLKTDSARVQEKIGQRINQLLIEEEFLEDIVEIGMHYRVGTQGDNLSGGQRQKLAIARVFLKEPSILIMDEATSGLDNNSQARIQNLLETRWKGQTTLIAVVHRLDTIKHYDRIAVMKDGRIVEIGEYQELLDKRGVLYELVSGKK